MLWYGHFLNIGSDFRTFALSSISMELGAIEIVEFNLI